MKCKEVRMDTQDANIHIHKVNPKEVRVEVVANASGVRNAQGKWRGGQYCSAVDCHNCTYRDGPRGVKFFRYPTNPTMKERWIKPLNHCHRLYRTSRVCAPFL